MFEKSKNTIIYCATAIKSNPKETFIFISAMLGIIIGEIIAVTIDKPGWMGFTAMGGMVLGAGFAAINICCCCPPKKNASIDSTSLTADNEAPLEESPPPAPLTSNPSTTVNVTAVSYTYSAVPPVETKNQQGKTFNIN